MPAHPSAAYPTTLPIALHEAHVALDVVAWRRISYPPGSAYTAWSLWRTTRSVS